jgi:hypothetical protein
MEVKILAEGKRGIDLASFLIRAVMKQQIVDHDRIKRRETLSVLSPERPGGFRAQKACIGNDIL